MTAGRTVCRGESRKFIGGVKVYSHGLGEKADDVIKRLSSAKAQNIVVVTSDREIISHAVTGRGVVAISCGEFEKKTYRTFTYLEQAGAGDKGDEVYTGGLITTKKKGNLRRLSKEESKKEAKDG